MDKLTERELEVARLVANGKKNNQIAETLYMKTRTVERHISTIFSKIVHNGGHSRVAVARWYWDNYKEDDKPKEPKRYLVIEITGDN